MLFRSARLVNQVFEACYTVYKKNGNFSAKTVIEKLDLSPATDKQGEYWQVKNITNSLNVLEVAKFISGAIQPEYTKNLGFLMEVRYGNITYLGRILKSFPEIIRVIVISLFLQRKKAIAILGVLSFVRLFHNAYLGTALIKGWFEYIAAVIILYILYLCLRKIID